MAEWTPDDEEKLKRLTEASFTASEIAARMPGRTRNSIISKWHRSGMKASRRPKRSKSDLPIKPTRIQAKQSQTPPHVMKLKSFATKMKEVIEKPSPIRRDFFDDEPKPLMIQLLDLEPLMCRWPYGDVGDADFGFCGHETAEHQSYCEFHRRMSVNGAPKQKMKKAA